MTAAGVCHSDQYTMDRTAEDYPYGFPLTLGHEGALEPRPAEAAGHFPAGEGEQEVRGEHAEADRVDRLHI